jgi:hypothetical protein
MSEENKNLEDNLPMVSYIMLHRIYDILTLATKYLSKDDGEEVAKLIDYHEQGYLMGPVPSFTPQGEDNE